MLKSWIFIPGSEDKFLKKSTELAADALIFDLEDSVSEQSKEFARLKITEVIKEVREQQCYVRVNALSSPYFIDDVMQVVREELTGIILPKVNNKEDIAIAEYMIRHAEEAKGLDPGTVCIVPLIETAEGLYYAHEIATASKRIKQIAFGAEDFMLDVNIRSGDEDLELLYARSQLVTVSRAANIESPIDSVYTNFKDLEGLESTANQAKKLGFQGKLLIHPIQIDVVNHVFAPSLKEIEDAKKIVQSYELSIENSKGAVQLDGEMIDSPIAKRAKRILLDAGLTEFQNRNE